MKIAVAIGLGFLTVSSVAFADHTLKDAMSYDKKIAHVVNSIQTASGVVCLVGSSDQQYTPGYPTSAAFTQVAQCFAKRGSGDQIGQLKVSYEWIITQRSVRPGKLIGVEFERLR